MQEPSEEDTKALNEIVERAKLNMDIGIVIRRLEEVSLALFTDASNFLKTDVPAHIGVFIAFVDASKVRKRDVEDVAEGSKTAECTWCNFTPVRWMSKKPVRRSKSSSD